MAGTWICSKNYAFDRGVPLPGAIAQFYMADTLTPMVVYVDYALTTPAGSTVVSNGNGQWPVVYLDEAPGFYRYRVIRPDGSIIDDLTTLAIIGPGAGGGGGGTPVDATQLLKTGMFIPSPQPGPIDGWVRANAKTIGSGASVGSERHNDDCQALFTFLWLNFSQTECPVSSGRGATALADWGANKVIATPDLRGRGIVGADKMGAAATAGRITTVSTASPDDIGATGGAEKVTLTVAQLPPHHHAVDPPSTTSGTDIGTHNHTFSGTTGNESANPTPNIPMSTSTGGGVGAARGGGAADAGTWPMGNTTGDHTHTFGGTTANQVGTHTHTVNIAQFDSGDAGGAAPVGVMAPFMISTWFIKL